MGQGEDCLADHVCQNRLTASGPQMSQPCRVIAIATHITGR